MSNALLFAALGLLVFVVVGGFFFGAFVLLNPSRTAKDRLRDLSQQEEVEAFDIIGVEDSGGGGGLASKLTDIAGPSSDEERSKQREMLMQAGYKNRHALEIFNGIRITLALAAPLLVTPFLLEAGLLKIAGGVLVSVAAGYYAPALMLTNILEKRQKVLLNSFPDALDLLVSCVEAGLGLDAAFRRVAMEIEAAAPELAREFQLVNHEISAGVPRVEALRHLQSRTGLAEIRSLVNMLAQAERFGTSIAKGLRIHARMTRQKRMSRAEEEAAKVSPKLTVVMILFLLPVLASVLIGPAILKAMEILGEQ